MSLGEGLGVGFRGVVFLWKIGGKRGWGGWGVGWGQAKEPKVIPPPRQHACQYASTILLRLGWPATEWETGPEPKMAEKWPAKWPAAILGGGPKMAEKWPGKWLDMQKITEF